MPACKPAAAALAALTLLPPAVWAAEPDNGPLWEFAVGGYGTYNTDYPGASQSSGNFLVLPFPIYHGKILRLGEDTERPIWAQLFAGDRIHVNLDTEFSFGATSADIPVRQGMPDLDPIFELGPELELRLSDNPEPAGNVYLALQARPAVTFDGFSPGLQGGTFSPELRYVRFFHQPERRLKIRVTPTFASSDYARYYYSVDPAFATPERPAYSGKGGYMGTTAGISYTQSVTKNFDIYVGARYQVLNGASNASSPLFVNKSNPIGVVAFIYKFWASKERRDTDR